MATAEPARCKACPLKVRPLDSILRDVEQLPGSLKSLPGWTSELVAAVASAKLTRLQMELGGYCFSCAYQTEVRAFAEEHRLATGGALT